MEQAVRGRTSDLVDKSSSVWAHPSTYSFAYEDLVTNLKLLVLPLQTGERMRLVPLPTSFVIIQHTLDFYNSLDDARCVRAYFVALLSGSLRAYIMYQLPALQGINGKPQQVALLQRSNQRERVEKGVLPQRVPFHILVICH